ncbi:Glutathione S-transferase 2 [Yamadazyma tenuis]|uniref:Glutathione S-transferase n=1 Tax=Candida tenuis (strain ATCC 10573 / BCRC 21748 / CBS 615 / JCM 9827 / NBRC 10315 / NRRL Y-1498 / VKM Y-70) TaxID=590646 RepID=G3B8B0_CANTC|nr:glutathione S-transferase [Yamadazyma tenuis ATCC 10573]EGV61729.1 glutathione S-transferase [Yamadazyma tenuis ATCC 10573]WEJ92961.1 Glutathione S-transferase 2 [Yamadazyma tenuis]
MSESLTLYTWGTPNGQKVSIFLELLGLKYNVKPLDISTNVQKEPEFLAINPNGRIPTLVDSSTGITISETAAIITYLADTYDKERKFSYEYGTKEYYKQLELTYFQMAGIGPMQGQAHFFIKYSKEDLPFAKTRYREETRRLYGVLEDWLKINEANGPYLVGDHISIPDICTVPWSLSLPSIGIEFEEFPLVKKWIKNLLSQPEIVKGFNVPSAPRSWPDFV